MADLLPAAWRVPDLFRQRLGATAGRQRAMAAEEHLLLVLHAPPKPNDNARVGRFFWRSPDGAWTSKDLGTGLNALSKHLDEFADAIARLDRQEETATTADDYFAVLEHLAPLHRSVHNLHGVLQDARKSCPDYRELIDLRDRAYEIERSSDLLYNEVKNSLDFLMARRAEEQARSSHRMAVSAHRLNLLAAFFFPLATLTAIFGVNLQHGWESESPPGPFLGVIAAGLALGIVLAAFVLRHGDDRRSRP